MGSRRPFLGPTPKCRMPEATLSRCLPEGSHCSVVVTYPTPFQELRLSPSAPTWEGTLRCAIPVGDYVLSTCISHWAQPW